MLQRASRPVAGPHTELKSRIWGEVTSLVGCLCCLCILLWLCLELFSKCCLCGQKSVIFWDLKGTFGENEAGVRVPPRGWTVPWEQELALRKLEISSLEEDTWGFRRGLWAPHHNCDKNLESGSRLPSRCVHGNCLSVIVQSLLKAKDLWSADLSPGCLENNQRRNKAKCE